MKVALRKESVDRNGSKIVFKIADKKSLSARRAWIEMLKRRLHEPCLVVALRKESVDRNLAEVQTLVCP